MQSDNSVAFHEGLQDFIFSLAFSSVILLDSSQLEKCGLEDDMIEV